MERLKYFVTADLKASTEGWFNKKDGKVFHSFKVLVKKLYL